jgi:phosphoglycolate phosphatase
MEAPTVNRQPSTVDPVLAGVHAIVFDLDGTLVDSFDDLAAAVNHVRALRSLPPLSLEEVKLHVGRGARFLLRQTTTCVDEADVEVARLEFLAYYKAHLFDAPRLYDGVLDALSALRDLPMAVLTNKPEAEARLLVDGLELGAHFRGVYGQHSFGDILKPDPRAMARVLDVLHVEPAQALMVGDSDVDVRAARDSGMRVVLVRTGLFHTSTLPADATIDTMAELPGLLGRR